MTVNQSRKHVCHDRNLRTRQSNAIETKLVIVTDVTVRQTEVMMWQYWQLYDDNDLTTNFRSGQHHNVHLRHKDDWNFPLLRRLAWDQRRCFNLLTCRLDVDNRFRLVSLQNLRLKFKDSCWFLQRLPQFLDHCQYFDLLTCLPTIDDRALLASCQTLEFKSKLSWAVCRKMYCSVI